MSGTLRELFGKISRFVETKMDSKAYYANAKTVYKFWLSCGFTKEISAGFTAQSDAESSFDPNAVGDHGQAFGIQQWHGDRAKAIKDGCGVDLHADPKPSLSDQLKAALWELKNTEKGALKHIVASKTAYDAGYAACKYWERPGSLTQPDKRGKTAEKWAEYFAKNPV
jgi:hypothetical protein